VVVANHDAQDWNLRSDIPCSDDDPRLLTGASSRCDGIAISGMAIVHCIGGRLLDCYALDSDAARDQPPFPVSYVPVSRGRLCLYLVARILLI
jgi:hypothetical protein